MFENKVGASFQEHEKEELRYDRIFHCEFSSMFFSLDFCLMLKLLVVILQKITQKPLKDAVNLLKVGHPEDGKHKLNAL